jgi:glycosyltransferase involved in cell wall biosynthesis
MAVAHSATATVLPGPIRVVNVDLDRPLPELSPFRSHDDDRPPYVGAWVNAFRAGRAVRHLDVDLDGRVIGPAELRDLLVASLGEGLMAAASEHVDNVPDEQLPTITVVVPSTFDRVERLERCVAALTAQDYPAYDVVLVDNRPEASTARAALWARIGIDRRVFIVAEARPGISAARNRGVSVATGEIVAFTDDDVEVESGWLRAIGRRFAAEPLTDGVTGLVLPMELETPAQVWFETSGSKIDHCYERITFRNDGAWRDRFLGGFRRGRYEVTAKRDGAPDESVLIYRGKFGMGANMSVRVAACREIGGFDEALGTGTPTGGGEDLLLLSRLLYAGRQLTYDPAVAIHHAHRRDYDDLRRQMLGYGSGYTAMLFALVSGDWRHLMGLAGYALRISGLLLRRSADRGAGEFPGDLARAEVRGFLLGPWTYLVSRRRLRRRTSLVGSQHSETVAV